MKVLHLTLKKKWFDMVGPDKPEEYREIKRYWIKRLCNEFEYDIGASMDKVVKEFDVVEFKNGYGKNDPVKRFKWDGVEMRTGNPEWGAEPGKEYFVIKLGELLTTPEGVK